MTAARKHFHYFSSTPDAYDSSQMGTHVDTGAVVSAGDVLVIETEKVIGISDTWPFAVTAAHGALHCVDTPFTPEIVALQSGIPVERVHEARLLACGLGW